MASQPCSGVSNEIFNSCPIINGICRVPGLSLFLEFRGYGLFNKKLHDDIAFVVRMESVVAQSLFQEAFLVHHSRKIIEISQPVLSRLFLEPPVDSDDLLGWAASRLIDRLALCVLCVIAHWKHRSNYDADVARSRQLEH